MIRSPVAKLTLIRTTIENLKFLWAIVRQHCPYEIRMFLERFTNRIISFFYPYLQITIHEYIGERWRKSEAYATAEAYLRDKFSDSVKGLTAELSSSKELVLGMDEHENVEDEFRGVKVCWMSSKSEPPSKTLYSQPDKRFYRLSFHKKYREMVTGAYLLHVMQTGKEIRERNRQKRLYTNSKHPTYKWSTWSNIVFKHPATFETMALEPEKKHEIVEDLLTFSRSKDFYARIGKAWKRGYLLYGPPGTGKSSLIAAMANLLNYDVYDLELTSVTDNTELKTLLTETTSKSIIVIEDIDCSLDLTGRRKKLTKKSSDENKQISHKEDSSKVTLSGVLNFIDGLCSACGGEKIIVFTTNYVAKLDPALIRRGRMDKHIELSYCRFGAFKVLAKNYLNLEAHPLFDEIEELIKEINITPADDAENLMPKSPSDDAVKCLSALIQALEEAREAAIAKAEETEENARKAVEKAEEESSLDEVEEESV